MQTFFVRYGQEKYYFDPPISWNILTSDEFQQHDQDMDVEQLIEKALDRPTGSRPLADRISPEDRVAIIIEDMTRASPKSKVLRILLDRLRGMGIPKENIKVVIALGTHKALSRAELEAGYGRAAVRDYHFTNHDCEAPDLIQIGRLETRTPVKINRAVHDATFKIGVGSIFPHPLNGFGGGCKILFPGVADYESILEHHLKYSFRRGSALGQLKGNRFYDEVCRLAQAGGLDFIINSVLDHNDRLYDVVCGEPVQAHLAGTNTCRAIISQTFSKKADVTIISSFPYSEGPQIMKPLAPASLITKKGGVIILVAKLTSPLPELVTKGCKLFREEHAGHLKDSLFERFDQNVRIVDGSAPELNMCMSQVILALNDYKVILVSEDIDKESVEKLGFLPAKDLNKARLLADSFVSNPDVHIIPAGGVILPMVKEA